MIRMTAAVLISLLCALPAAADDKHDHGAGATSEGEVRKVDKEAKKITIKHGPLQNLDMPAMTMVFQVKDPAMLDQVKAGDKVKFQAEKVGGAFTVTKIDPAK
jgi:Cu/Ag efflux protein CusF